MEINQETYNLELFVSGLSDKRKVVLNKKVLFEKKKEFKLFTWHQKIGGIDVSIKQESNNAPCCFIEGQEFQYLMNNRKIFLYK